MGVGVGVEADQESVFFRSAPGDLAIVSLVPVWCLQRTDLDNALAKQGYGLIHFRKIFSKKD